MHFLSFSQAIMPAIIIISLHSVNALFAGANIIYEVSIKHPIIHYLSLCIESFVKPIYSPFSPLLNLIFTKLATNTVRD